MADSQMETYLQENHGHLDKFHDFIVNGVEPGMAFMLSLSRPDIFRIRKAGMWDNLREDDQWDSAGVLSVIEFLKESAADYPEDHPLWSLR